MALLTVIVLAVVAAIVGVGALVVGWYALGAALRQPLESDDLNRS